MKKVGIFGGTFSPPHIGHISSALHFRDALSLDTLIIIPTNIPPHKQVQSNAPLHRLEMTKLAFEGCKRAYVSDYEIQKSGKSYTAETLKHFKEDDTELYFLCGTDMFLTLESWYRPDIICSLATIVLAKRDSLCDDEIKKADKLLKQKFNARTLMLENKVTELSSSEIRKMIKEGKSVKGLISDSVYAYITEKGLYREGL